MGGVTQFWNDDRYRGTTMHHIFLTAETLGYKTANGICYKCLYINNIRVVYILKYDDYNKHINMDMFSYNGHKSSFVFNIRGYFGDGVAQIIKTFESEAEQHIENHMEYMEESGEIRLILDRFKDEFDELQKSFVSPLNTPVVSDPSRVFSLMCNLPFGTDVVQYIKEHTKKYSHIYYVFDKPVIDDIENIDPKDNSKLFSGMIILNLKDSSQYLYTGEKFIKIVQDNKDKINVEKINKDKLSKNMKSKKVRI